MDNLDMMAAADLFRLRTTTKRQHTNLVTRVHGLISRRASRVVVEMLSATLADVLERITAVNDQYVITGGLNEQEQVAAEAYIQEVAALNEQAQLAIRGYAQAVANRTAWSVTDSNAGRVLQLNPQAIEIEREVPENEVVNHDSIVSELAKNREHEANVGDHPAARNITAAQQPTIGALVSGLAGDTSDQSASDVANQAKRRKIELEFELERNRIERSRKMDDLLRQSVREEEDLKMAIEREKVLAGIFEEAVTGSPIHSSTPRGNAMNPIEQSSRTPQYCEKTATFAPPSRWPKIVVEKFNGDPRKWQRFAHGIHATVRDANIPDSYKLLGLQDSIMDDLRKRMCHIFNGSYAFEAAWNELESKYGNPGLIMQAHNQHLLQVQPFKAGDFNALFSLAADVRDAVSSVPDGHLKEFTYSTVITSLASKLPIQLQIDWGKFAYSLRPNLPSLRDFDKWIDIAVGAEEYRGIRLSTPGSNASKPPSNYIPRQQADMVNPVAAVIVARRC